jgi:Protein of unknown function (DUF3618)
MSIDSSFASEESFDTTARLDIDAQKSPETLEREIDARRASIGSLVDALENKLSPGQLVDQVLSFSKSNGGEFFTNFGNTVKANPVPTLLTSIGVMWLMLGQNRRPPAPGESMFDHLGERTSSTAEHLSDTLGNAKARIKDTAARMAGKTSQLSEQASDLGDSVAGFTHNVGEKVSASAHNVSDTLRQQGQQLQSRFDYMLREQPLALAAIGIALGAAIGAALPATEQENKLMGAASDRVTRKAKSMASETYDKATELGKEFVDDISASPKPSGNDTSNPSFQPSSYQGQ